MKKIISEIIETELNKTVDSISEITGLGLVNKIFDVKCKDKNYIVRINQDQNKAYEFWKEKWCMEKASSSSIPSPEVLKIGLFDELPFMVLNKIEGLNGSKCSPNGNLSIWKKLGRYANKFHKINQIDELNVSTDEFHPNWLSKLEYNIVQLSLGDSLLKKKICLLYTSPSPRDATLSRMPSSA